MDKFVFVTRSLGRLSADNRATAEAVAVLCRRRTITVWVDHTNAVFADTPSAAANAPADWIVGTYRGQATLESIRGDLQTMCSDRGNVDLRSEGLE